MREIKFRGKRLDNKEFVYGSFIHNSIDALCIIDNDAEQYEIDPNTVGQYTGLKDVMDSHVYEGDNVSDGEFIYIVTWDIEMAQYYIDPVKCIKDDEYPLFLVPYTLLGNALKLTVIGNIYNTEK